MTPVVPHGNPSAYGRGNGQEVTRDLARHDADTPCGERWLLWFEVGHQWSSPAWRLMVTPPHFVVCGDTWAIALCGYPIRVPFHGVLGRQYLSPPMSGENVCLNPPSHVSERTPSPLRCPHAAGRDASGRNITAIHHSNELSPTLLVNHCVVQASTAHASCQRPAMDLLR